MNIFIYLSIWVEFGLEEDGWMGFTTFFFSFFLCVRVYVFGRLDGDGKRVLLL